MNRHIRVLNTLALVHAAETHLNNHSEDEELYDVSNTVLSIVVLHLRTPLGEVDQEQYNQIQLLKNLLNKRSIKHDSVNYA